MKRAARVVMLLGVVAIGLVLFRSAGAREVVLVYDLHGVPAPLALGVWVEKGGEVYRQVRFSSPGEQVRHTVKLPDGTYHLRYGIDRAQGGPLRGERDIRVSESQTIVLSLAP